MKAVLTVLGSGTSTGVPTIGCNCPVCTSSDPRDNRTRPSILVQYDGRSVLIDTTPDFRQQALREGIQSIDAVLYTHHHADHILGLDDLRPISFRSPEKIPLYAHRDTCSTLRAVFSYIFNANYKFGGIARVELHELAGPLPLFGVTFEPVVVLHGDLEIYGYKLGKTAYLTDFSEIPDQSLEKLQDLDVLFLDALRRVPHPTHSTLDNSLRIVNLLKPRQAFFTHISHDLPHQATNESLPAHVRLAHDGLRIHFEI